MELNRITSSSTNNQSISLAHKLIPAPKGACVARKCNDKRHTQSIISRDDERHGRDRQTKLIWPIFFPADVVYMI